MEDQKNMSIGDFVYYKGNKMKAASQSEKGFAIIVNPEIKNNWVKIKYISLNNEFGCDLNDIQRVFMKKEYLINFGFESQKLCENVTEFFIKTDDNEILKLFYSPRFGFVEKYESLKINNKKSLKEILNLNDVNVFLKFIEPHFYLSRIEVFKKFFK